MRLPLFVSFFVFIFISARAVEPFEIKEGDRVLLLGDTLLERENTYGYLETRMHEQFPDRHFTVRNLSWAGETPRGWSRASFDSPEKGWERLQEDIAKVRPTVVFLGFGMAASLQEMTDRSGDITLNPDPARYGGGSGGDKGGPGTGEPEPMSAARFKRELGELMDAIVAQAAAISGRVGVPPAGSGVSPERSSQASGDVNPTATFPLPSQVRKGGTPSPAGGTPTLPETPVRFVLLSPIRHEDLRAVKPGLPDPAAHNKLLEQYSNVIKELAREHRERFISMAAMPVAKKVRTERLAALDDQIDGPWTDNGIHLTERGYAVLAAQLQDGLGWGPVIAEIKARGTMGKETARKVSEASAQREALRAAVIRKNELFFHQFRPANSTYLFGFRKHEQGQNAKEMPMFDPLIAAAEAEIDRLKRSSAAASAPGSALVPSAGSGILPERTSADAPNPAAATSPAPAAKVREGGTPSPALKMSALPGAPTANVNAAGPIPGTPPPLPDFTVADGYQIELWAQNPYLEKPTQMNWDPQGRLWVCSSSLYPQIEPGQPANDKILVLSDTDGDGKADKSEVFADGLLIPTGVAPDLVAQTIPIAFGNPPADAPKVQLLTPSACYVGQSTELLYFRDTDGDGKADEKRIVFSGFGTEDTHHIVHTLHWGPDGRLYFHQSVYIHTHLETPWGMVRLNSGGVFAYDPRTERVEVFIKGLWNTWGQAEDDWGQSFFTDGAGSTGLTWGFPGAIFAPFEGSRRQMASISPGSYPKFAGLEIVKSPAFPAEWQGNAVTCDFRAHRIVRFAIEDLAGDPHAKDAKVAKAENEKVPDPKPSDPLRPLRPLREAKSGYTTVEQPDLVRTTDLSFRPIDVKMGPDGALYVADWSNPVINHGEVDFRDPRRDHHMGRIWRITKKDTPALKWEPLLGKKNEELLDKLLSKSAWEQQQARRIVGDLFASEYLSPDPRPVHEALRGFLRGLDSGLFINGEKPLENYPERVREVAYVKSSAMRILAPSASSNFIHDLIRNGLDDRAIAITPRLWGQAWTALSANTWNLLPAAKESDLDHFATDLAKGTIQANPRVRLEAMRALSRIPTATSASLVLDAALKTPENDPHYDFAAWLSINDLAQPWTDAIASGAWKTEGHEAQLAYGLKSIDPTLASTTLAQLFAAGKVPVDGSGPWIELIGDAGGPAELQRLLDGLLAGYVGDCCETDETRAIDSKLAFTTEAAEGKSGGRPEGRATIAERAIAALQTAARVRNLKPAAHAELVTALFHGPGEIGLGAIRLAGLWHAPEVVAKIGELLDSRETKPPLRRAAVDGLRAAGGPAALGFLRVLTRADETTDTRAAALVATAQVKLDAGLVLAAEVLPTFTDEVVLLGAWRGLLAVKGAPDAFAVKFVKQEVLKAMPAPVIAAAIHAAREAGRPGAKLLAALAPMAGGAATAPSTDYLGLAAQTKQNGDPAKGELIYRRATSACVTCHAIGGAGGKVGPDMTSIGASAPLDYLIESILNPNAKVKEGFNAVSLTLADGTTATGIQARETASEVILRDAAGKETGIPKSAIKGKTDIGSMMPAGLTATMQSREAIDLYAFLSQLGKPGAYDASKGKVARVWRMYPGTAAGEVVSATYDPAKNPGFPGYTLVDGRFVKDLLTEATTIARGGADTVLLATQFQSSGKTHLTLTGVEKAWLDGNALVLGGEVAPELANGTHTLVVKIGVKELPAVLRAESEDARFLGN